MWCLTDAARRTFLATSSLEGLLSKPSDSSPRPRLGPARQAADQALAKLSKALRQHRAADPSQVGKEALAEAVAGVSSRAREVSLIAEVLERLEVMISELNDGVEELCIGAVGVTDLLLL